MISFTVRPVHRALRRAVSLAVAAAWSAVLGSACASTGATFRSGVGDAYPEHPPYAAGASRSAVRANNAALGHLPIVFQDGASQPSVFDPKFGPGTALGDLLVDMNAWLDSVALAGRSTRLVEGGRVSAVAHKETRFPPDVMFGCITENMVPDADCVARGDSALGRKGQRMRLAVGRPSAEWTVWMQEVMQDAKQGQGVQKALVLTLEVGQYWPRQRGLVGKKEVELGTEHVASIPWLTSMETPVSVLQLTGALVGADGKAIRIGAEGIMARRTRLLVSAVGGQELLGNDDVQSLRQLRRDDVAGQPLAWQVALRKLLAELTGGP